MIHGSANIGGMMWTIGLKLLREGTVNLLIHTNVKKEVVKQVLMDALSRSLGLSLLNRVSMRARVKGSHLGHLEDGGARLAAPLRVAFTWTLWVDHGGYARLIC